MTSWVKLHKKLIDKPIWKNSTLEQRVILITLLCSVNDEATEWDYNGEKFIVEAGQLVTSIAEIVEMCDDKNITTSKVRTALARFEKLGFLTSKITNKFRLVTIVNWGVYQLDEEENRKQNSKHLTSTSQALDKHSEKDDINNTISDDNININNNIYNINKDNDINNINNINTNNNIDYIYNNNILSINQSKSINQSNINNINNINNSNIQITGDSRCISYTAIRDFEMLFRDKIEYETFSDSEKEVIDTIINLAIDLLSSEDGLVRTGNKCYPREFIHSRLLSLDSGKIKYLLGKWDVIGKLADVKNPKRYMQTTLINTALNYSAEFQNSFNANYYRGKEWLG